MTNREVHFPDKFLWGTSTSGYQTEGGGDNTDWWRYERAEGTHCEEVSGDACDSWNRYEQDLDLIVELGLNAYRLSVEWARVEPQRGVIDCRRAGALSPHARSLSRPQHPSRRHAAPLHAPAVGRRSRRIRVSRDRVTHGALRPRRRRRVGRPHRHRVHGERTEHRRADGLSHRRLPAGAE